jgi:hypothetical protein
MRSIIFIIFVFQASCSLSQKQLISKENALEIALSAGLEKGLEEYNFALVNDSIWKVTSLICDDYNQTDYDYRLVNAKTGKVIKERNITLEMSSQIEMDPPDYTHLNYSFLLDTLPIVSNDKSKLDFLDNSSYDIIFSPDDANIAFLSKEKIILYNIKNDSVFQSFDSCIFESWSSNDSIIAIFNYKYSKSNSLSKTNIYTKGKRIISILEPYIYDFSLSPDEKWIAYTSNEATKKKYGNYSSVDGAGSNLCLRPIEGGQVKYITELFAHVHFPIWTSNSDSILFYVGNEKYFCSNLQRDSIICQKIYRFQDLTLHDYKYLSGVFFPYKHRCQILEIDANSMLPKRVLESTPNRYRIMRLSHNRKYLIFSDSKDTWIKNIEQ